MDIKKFICLLQKVDVIDVDPETQQKHVYFSRIEDMNEKSITIAAPYARRVFLPPKYRKQYIMRVPGEGCAYFFRIHLLETIKDPIPLWVIAWPVDIERVQMRDFVRLAIILDVTVELLDSEEEEKTFMTLTRDISVNGVRIVLKHSLPIGTKLKVTLPIFTEMLEVVGVVIRVSRTETEDKKYEVVIKFEEIQEKIKAKILRFIYKKQIERHQKEAELFEE